MIVLLYRRTYADSQVSQVRASVAAAGRGTASVPGLQNGMGDTAEKAEQETGGEAVVNTCCHCGNSGPDVVEQLVYIGGQGHCWQSLCGDRVACWQRHDAKFEPAGAVDGLRVQGKRTELPLL